MKTLTFVLSALAIAGFAAADDPSGLGVNGQSYHDYCDKGLESARQYASARACFKAPFDVPGTFKYLHPSILEGVINDDGDDFYVAGNCRFTLVAPPGKGDDLEVHVKPVTSKKKNRIEKAAEERYRQLHNGQNPAENCSDVIVYHLSKEHGRYIHVQTTWCPGEHDPIAL
ncbi:uncharacterized protein UTRI_10052 [Ustilago trichophora]|uniref:Uncharacterized protein n=1 Tax=Ustilago trichophora TaxID=86804 RepID=A0A5C3DX32_9BASI|nr:uncharacterized protein UTRI_10052 [Ustilago trichophora]